MRLASVSHNTLTQNYYKCRIKYFLSLRLLEHFPNFILFEFSLKKEN